MWSVVALAVFSAHPAPSSSLPRLGAATKIGADARSVTGTASRAESPNFQIHCHPGCGDARELAKVCEEWRDHLTSKWLEPANSKQWVPPCVVVAHTQRGSYLAAVGRGGERSFGSTWIGTQGVQISERRIDLLADPTGQLSALGHELTHVVVAEAFDGQQPPPWANEGIALLSDSSDKQARHENDLATAIRSRVAFRCLELMSLDHYPSPDRIPAFYGQSASIVKMLSQRGKPHEFLSFLSQAEKSGYDRALEKSYGISRAELEPLWRDYFARSQASSAAAQNLVVKPAK